MLEKKEHYNELYDFYFSLLTEKQQRYFELYYREDYSLNEIAEHFNVSRNAIYDHIRKVEGYLNTFEEKLSLLKNKKQRKELYEKLEKTKDYKIIAELRKLDE